MMEDRQRVLDAISEAFNAQVTLLFRVLCDSLGGRDSNAKTRFDAGLDTARKAMELARKPFLE